MKKVIFETDDALFQFDRKEVTEHLKFIVRQHKLGKGNKLLKFISNTANKKILIREKEYYFGYVALYLISKGRGSVRCKICKQIYPSKVLKRFNIGRSKSADVNNVVFEKPFALGLIFCGPETLPVFGGYGYKCPRGHELISRITWRT